MHTWGQNLVDHPHLHCIVPGGGLSTGGNWIHARADFFIPVKVLARKFRGKFLAFLRTTYESGGLKFGGTIAQLQEPRTFNSLLHQLYAAEWVVFCKKSFKSPDSVLEYLGRYTHRVAISNSRIKSIAHRKVSFEWKDRRDGNKTKIMTLDALEFLRRFLLHILPGRFMKIRHYGLLGNRNRAKVKTCQLLLKSGRLLAAPGQSNTQELILKLFGVDIAKCPCCGQGKMTLKRRFDYNARRMVE